MQKKCAVLLVMFFALLAQSSFATVHAKGDLRTIEKSKSLSADQQEIPIRAILIALEKSFTVKNSVSAAELFAEDAVFVNQSGDVITGRQALQARFENLFKSMPEAIGIHPDSIRFPAENVALIVGEVSRKQGQEDLPATRFSMVLVRVKDKDNWLINEVTESALKPTQIENQLQQLDWLIGKWSTTQCEDSVELDVEWSPSKKFITSKYTLFKHGQPPQVDNQVIGWDPQHNSIVSWHFDASGGFGHGIWTAQPNDKKWTVEVTGIGADGSNTTAHNTFSLRAVDEFVWQSINRSLDGTPVADTEPLTAHRVKP